MSTYTLASTYLLYTAATIVAAAALSAFLRACRPWRSRYTGRRRIAATTAPRAPRAGILETARAFWRGR